MPLTPFRTVLPQTETGLLLYLKLNDGSSGQAIIYANDCSQHGNHGTLNNFAFSGTSDWSTGKYGKGLRLDGNDDYVRIIDPVGIRFPAGSPFTVAVWYNSVDNYPSGTGSIQLIVFKGGSAGYFCIGSSTKGKGWFEWDTEVETGGFVTDGKWHFIVGVRKEDGEGLLYVDGELVASGVVNNGQVANTASDLFIGQRDDGAYRTVGIIDEVRIYNRALNSGEIQAQFKGVNIKPFR